MTMEVELALAPVANASREANAVIGCGDWRCAHPSLLACQPESTMNLRVWTTLCLPSVYLTKRPNMPHSICKTR